MTIENRLLPQTHPDLLRDVLVMKRNRGDIDVADFREVCRDFGSGIDATIEGAARAMRRWTMHRPTWLSVEQHKRRQRFLADLDAVLNGTFGNEFFRPAASGNGFRMAAE